MKKKDVLSLFKTTLEASRELKISRQSFYTWDPDAIPESAERKVRDWFLRTKGEIPQKFLPKRKLKK